MVLVANTKRKDEYLNKLNYSLFKNLLNNNSVSIVDYEVLNKQCESIIKQQKLEFILKN
jgi:CRISPR/Cas system-associated endoribonuclease Cas2